jgi:hypothetical protein
VLSADNTRGIWIHSKPKNFDSSKLSTAATSLRFPEFRPLSGIILRDENDGKRDVSSPFRGPNATADASEHRGSMKYPEAP